MNHEAAFAVCRGLYPGKGCACESRGKLPCFHAVDLLEKADGDVEAAIRAELKAIDFSTRTGVVRHIAPPQLSAIERAKANAAAKRAAE